ncbi:MAG: FAD:protein FMN transferase [Planctomycetota bacterium]
MTAPNAAPPICLALDAMATRFELVLPDVPADSAAAARLRAAGEAALEEVRLTEERWSLFRRDSFLAHIMRAAHTTPVRLDEDDWDLFGAAQRAFELSGGAFDPCLAPQMAGAGFARPVAIARAQPGTFADVALDARARTVSLRRPGLALDFGGVAKGHALDRAARALADAGVRSALLHGGTSAVLALGGPFRVLLGGEEDAPEAPLADAVLAVSAHHGRRTDAGASHVLDPRRPPGVPDAGDVKMSAAAIALAYDADPAPSALADALSTALLVHGAPLAPEALPHVTQALKPHGAPWRIAAGPPLIQTRALPLP